MISHYDWYWYPRDGYFLFAFRNKKDAKAFSSNKLRKVIDMAGVNWFTIQIKDKSPTKYIEQLCGLEVTEFKKPTPAKTPKQDKSESDPTPPTKGWEKINTFEEFKKDFTIRETKDKSGKELILLNDKKSSYTATGISMNGINSMLRSCFQSRMMRTFKNDAGNYVLILPATTDHTRLIRAANAIGFGTHTVYSGRRYGEDANSLAYVFEKQEDRDKLLSIIESWSF